MFRMDFHLMAQLRGQYRLLKRSQREKLMCAMIRVNYGTAWHGDEEWVRHFLPEALHTKLHLNGLNDVIELLCPMSDEPTESGIRAKSAWDSGNDATLPLSASYVDSTQLRKVKSGA